MLLSFKKGETFASELIGTWTEIKSKETWTFEKKSDKEYKLILSKKMLIY